MSDPAQPASAHPPQSRPLPRMPSSYRVDVPLRWSDMDAYGHVNNVQFLRLLEDARVVAIREWFLGRPSMLDEGIVVSRHAIEYRAPLTFRPAPVEAMWVATCTAPASTSATSCGTRQWSVTLSTPLPRPASRLRLHDGPPAPPLAGRAHRTGLRHSGEPVRPGGPADDRHAGVRRRAVARGLKAAARARAVDAEGRHAPRRRGVLAAWVGVLPGSGILAEGTVLGLRTFALATPADLDVIVPLGAITDRTHRGAGRELPIPPTRALAPWSALTPPRGPSGAGWRPPR